MALVFALTLAARTWVKAAEPQLLRRRRRTYESAEDAEGPGGEPAPALREVRR
jgi:hypothetical protein